jgi:hypothetical protein
MTLRELPKEVLERGAVVYVRQSTGAQVQENLESQRRQYGLVDLARQDPPPVRGPSAGGG